MTSGTPHAANTATHANRNQDERNDRKHNENENDIGLHWMV